MVRAFPKCPTLIRFASALIVLGATAGALRAEGIEFASQISGFEFRAVESLPSNPTPAAPEVFCGQLQNGVNTAAGRLVEQAGWRVSTEAELAGLTFVAFIGKVEPGTSGSCALGAGNIGIFKGENLRGLIYAPQGTPAGIGSFAVRDGAVLRIWDGELLPMPIADLQLIGDDLVILRNVASRDSFCGGSASIPNSYGLPLHIARQVLLAEGWTPHPAEDASSSDWIGEMQAKWPELQDCSGTGFGYCAWQYSRATGQSLALTTAGEAPEGGSPMVIDATADCTG